MQQICNRREFLEFFFLAFYFQSDIEYYSFLFDKQILCYNLSAKLMEC